jgi:hypothetical protein
MSEVAFVLRGKSNSGKSQTIKQVYENLLQEGAVPELPLERIGWKIDFYAVVVLRGVRVGILSRGDEAGQVSFYLSILLKMRCSVIVCATRTTGGTVAAVSSLCSLYRVKPIDQVRYAPSFQTAGNSAMAKCITARVSDATDA